MQSNMLMHCYETTLLVTRDSEYSFTFRTLTGYDSFRTLVLFTIEGIQSEKFHGDLIWKKSLNGLKQHSEVCEWITSGFMIMVRMVYFWIYNCNIHVFRY